MPDVRPGRIARLAERLAGARLDALLVTSLPNIRYLTGFSGSNALVLVTSGQPVLITDFRYATQVAEEVGELARVTVEPLSLWTGLWRKLNELPAVVELGFESAQLLHRDYQRLLDAGEPWHWRPTFDLVEGLRERKDPGELALIERAAAVATGALGELLPRVHAGMTEVQIAGTLEALLRDGGSEGFPFPTIVAAGPRSALPHARSSSRVVEQGDFLLIDFGAIIDGYCADVTRTVTVGRASDRQREVYAVVRDANAMASRAVRAGMLGRDADAVARHYIGERGYGDAFGHSLGHGIGLEVHEALVSPSPPTAAPPDAVVTIEPGIYVAGWGGVRIEDDVFLGPAGPRVLTAFSRELIELV